MKRLLVIAWYFPPMGGGGVQRTLSFVRHLHAAGWRITVLTGGDPGRYWAQDPALLDRVPEGVEVLRVSDAPLWQARRVARRLVPRGWRGRFDAVTELPDRQASWRPFATSAAQRWLRDHPVDAIYSTSAPWTAHLVARDLARRTGARWVADFRDPWTQNQTFAPATALHARLAGRWERDVLDEAAVVLANTERNARDLRARGSARAEIVALPNGWEADETEGLAPPGAELPLRVGYAGSFYPGYQPDAFYRHLRAAFDLRPELRPQVRVQLCGKTEQAAAARAAGLADVVTERGYVSQPDALRHLAQAHANLLVLPDSAESGWVPQKLYVYLRLGRPVVAVIPPGEADDILARAGGRSLVLRPGDPDGGARLAAFLDALAEDPMVDAGFDPAVVATYDRAALAARLERLLSPIAQEPPVG